MGAFLDYQNELDKLSLEILNYIKVGSLPETVLRELLDLMIRSSETEEDAYYTDRLQQVRRLRDLHVQLIYEWDK